MNSETFLKAPPLLPDMPDSRDRLFTTPTMVPQRGFSLRAYALPAFTQQYGTCAAYAATQLCWSVTRQVPELNGIKISPMDLYWRTRERMGTIPEDTGSTMRETMRALTNPGVVPWFVFPDNQDYRKRPPVSSAPRFRIPGYISIPVGDKAFEGLRHVLFYHSIPLLVGLRIPERFISDQYAFGKNGYLLRRTSEISEDEPTYNHCMLIDGSVDNHAFEVLNSWGPEWGQNGGGIIHRSWLESPDTCLGIWTIDLSSTDKHGLQ